MWKEDAGALQATSYIPCVARAVSLYTSIIRWGLVKGQPHESNGGAGVISQSQSEGDPSRRVQLRPQSKDVFLLAGIQFEEEGKNGKKKCAVRHK